MAIESNSYQKINWGWLNDYNGYKFAPITFFEQLYTEDGMSFKQEYEKQWSDLEDGSFVAGASKSLVEELFERDENDILVSIGYQPYNIGTPNTPIYFNNGIPALCDKNLMSNVFGHINYFDNATGENSPSKIITTQMQQYQNAEAIIADLEARKALTNDDAEKADFDERIQQQRLIQQQAQARIAECSIINAGTFNGGTFNGHFIGDIEGNSSSATKLKNARNFTIGNTTRSFNGTQNVAWTNSDIGADVNLSCAANAENINQLNISVSVNGVNKTAKIPTATDGRAGIVTASGTQQFSGVKQFNNRIIISNMGQDADGENTPDGSDANHYHLVLRNETLTRGTKPSKDCDTRIIFADGAGKTYSALTNRITSSNSSRVSLVNYLPTANRDGNKAYAKFYLTINENETCEAGVTNGSGLGGKADSIVFMGAAWNDYAEFRDQVIAVEPGYCVASTDDGKVYKTTEKFQACDGIVSDTYGFAIGRSETYQTPLAVSGRVLAYCAGNRYDYHAGDTVCAGPEGKVCKMTREEVKEYPDRIIGIVSEIPEYDEWTGKKINGRIWIKVK